ncbi:MAG TPA: methionine aminotransferase [Vicinamibacterales bacterium]|nr:methionine aminotransferase [Vicinamibacterales bacterium]
MTVPFSLASKLPAVGTTIFTVMSKLAADLGAINLSQGFPDFDCDPALIDAVARHMREGRNQYAPMQGVPALRQAIAAKYDAFHSRRYDPDAEVTVTSGATEAIFCAVTAVLRAGEEALVLEPCYDSYVPAIELSGGVPVVVPLQLPDYKVDWDAVREAVTPRTRLLIINSPHNPTGSILTDADITELTAIVSGTNIVIVSDEVYEHLIFDGAQHESMARHPQLAARSFVIGSFGKTYHVTGWKVGYAVAPAALMAEFRKVHQFVTFSTNTPMQHAIADVLSTQAGLRELAPFFQAKRDLFLRLMEGSRFRPLPCRGSYFQLMDYSAISRDEDVDFAVRLTKEHGVASIPTSPFLHRSRAPRVLRFCFAKKDDTLERAAERLRTI